MKPTLNLMLANIAFLVVSMTAADAQNMSSADRQKLLENITQADANSDGMVTRGEFETLIRLNAEDQLGRAARIQNAGQTTRVFKRIDANGDGVLTQQELQAMAEQARG